MMTNELGLEFHKIQKKIHEKQMALICLAGLKGLLNMDDPIISKRVETVQSYIEQN